MPSKETFPKRGLYFGSQCKSQSLQRQPDGMSAGISDSTPTVPFLATTSQLVEASRAFVTGKGRSYLLGLGTDYTPGSDA